MNALSGIRILDLTHILSGPHATMMLADLGAETIKIEPPGVGERTRGMLADDPAYSLHGMGAYFLTLNRNKKSVTLDLKREAGRALFYELVGVADVVAYNFSVGVAARLGIDHQSLSAINPRVITCSVTGFGEVGPDRDQVSFDMVAQGTGGGMSVTGAPGDPPTRAGLPVGDLGGAMGGVIGVLAALVARERTGLGQHVDISMQDMQVSLLSYMATMYSLSGEAPAQMGNGHLVHVPYNTYRAADGWLIIAVVADQFWTALLSAVELPELDTEANRTSAGRRVHRDAIETRLRRALATRPRAHWLAALRAARVPCAPVRDIAEVMADPHLRARGMIAQVALPQGGAVQMPGNPIKLSGDAGSQAYASPPALGQHTDEVLRELLGKTDAELADLRARGVI